MQIVGFLKGLIIRLNSITVILSPKNYLIKVCVQNFNFDKCCRNCFIFRMSKFTLGTEFVYLFYLNKGCDMTKKGGNATVYQHFQELDVFDSSILLIL